MARLPGCTYSGSRSCYCWRSAPQASAFPPLHKTGVVRQTSLSNRDSSSFSPCFSAAAQPRYHGIATVLGALTASAHTASRLYSPGSEPSPGGVPPALGHVTMVLLRLCHSGSKPSPVCCPSSARCCCAPGLRCCGVAMALLTCFSPFLKGVFILQMSVHI